MILSRKEVQGVSFTGSSKAGSIIASAAGKYLKRAVMELGGSDPMIVLKDSDVEFAADIAIKSRLANAGQVCCSAKRFIVHEDKYEEFL